MYRTKILWMIVAVMTFASCVKNKNGVPLQNTTPTGSKVFEITEVVQGDTYTYLNVKENMNNRWVAVSKQDVKPGEVYYYDNALEMNNFHSKEIDRTFDVIYFVSQISKTPLAQMQNPMGGGGAMPAHSGKVASEQNSGITLEKQSGEITVADIFANRKNYEGKEIEIRGIVVKVNESVMGKNWIHIQDGTNSDGSFDLTVTSQDLPKVDDEVTFKGKITLDKDFGAGYFYDVIMEDATLAGSSDKTVQL